MPTIPPVLGPGVLFRSRTEDYSDAPAVITGIQTTIVVGGNVLPLTDENHVHLTVLSPEKPAPFSKADRHQNAAGIYQEFDIPYDDSPDPAAGTWRWE